MNCPNCGNDSLRVVGTLADCETVARRRICGDCKQVVFTLEYEDNAAKDEFYRILRGHERERNKQRYKHD